MKNKKLILLLATLLSIGNVSAQSSGSNTPYSRYGWGLLSDEAQGFNKGMAGVALGMRDKGMINRQNPASYSAIDSVTFLFDIGASLQNGHWSENNNSINALNSTLDYVEGAFRLFKNVGFSFGMRPYSIIGYDFNTTQLMTDIDGYGEKTATSTFEGDGGLHTVYGGIGAQIVKNFSLGFNVGYVWGNYNHNTSMAFNETTIQSLARLYKGTINTYTLDAGLQYTQKLNKKNNLTIGFTFGLGHKINEQGIFINQKRTSSSVVGADTTHIPNAYEMPMSYGIGLAYSHGQKLTLAFDYTMQRWKNCRFPELQSDESYKVTTNTFDNRQKFTFGGEYIPNPEGLKVTDHICYRAGFSYTTPYIKVNNGTGPKNYLVSAGVGIPIVNNYNTRSMVNVSVQWEHVAPGSKSYIKEDYIRLCLGLSFNANWFNKWKIE